MAVGTEICKGDMCLGLLLVELGSQKWGDSNGMELILNFKKTRLWFKDC
jgi:hypothetical protein